MVRSLLLVLLATLLGAGCGPSSSPAPDPAADRPSPEALAGTYATVRLDADVSALSANQKEMVTLFIEAAQAMDGVFWEQAYGNRDSLLQTIGDPKLRRVVEINYGPWDRLNDNEPFVDGVGPKPPGANFYPEDVTPAEFERAVQADSTLDDRDTMVRRLPDGTLTAIPYHEFFLRSMETAASRLREAAALTDNESVRRYLERRAEALTTGDYRPSDRAWMDVTDNDLDLIVGPVGTDEDQLFGSTDPCKRVTGTPWKSGGPSTSRSKNGDSAASSRTGKAAAGALVLRRDRAWSERLARYAELLPMLQAGLPVPDAYKPAAPGRDSDLGAYEVLYVAGDANAGPKPIAVNLPNDEVVQREKGTRRLQLKNAMRAKFDAILTPIAEVLVAEEQRPHVTFDAFFGNTMFHEVAHGLGVTTTITGEGPVREALKDHYTTLEEGKADVLGLYAVRSLAEAGALDVELMAHDATVLASIFRSVRFGPASAHGRANLIRFNYFREQGALARDPNAGTYAVNPGSMRQATNALSRTILTLQGDGDYEAVASFVERYATMPEPLRADLDRLDAAGIPVDVAYEQGPSTLRGLAPAPAAE
jgi:hypothetical protein